MTYVIYDSPNKWWLDSITDSMDMNLSKLQGIVEDRGAWQATVHGLQRVRYNLVMEQEQHHHVYITMWKGIFKRMCYLYDGIIIVSGKKKENYFILSLLKFKSIKT